ncbi:MAG TPA: translation initiation factor IF-2 [Candidatus Binataceae bacterium]|jgi:translation initiation factor IF-2|nr:translation initiation factor IF-2 [Candidatus Binataceae bacterium]
MARKRIKTLANEWGVSVEDVLASCSRLELPHAQSESALLSREEADRVKSDLDARAHRVNALRRETLVETSAGTVLEKRLNATVMRRRHTEPTPSAPTENAPAFQFEAEAPSSPSESFVAPLFDEPLQVAPELPEVHLPEPPPVALLNVETPAETSTPAEVAPAPAPNDRPEASNGAAVRADAEMSAPTHPSDRAEERQETAAEVAPSAPPSAPEPAPSSAAAAAPQPAEAKPASAVKPPAEPQRVELPPRPQPPRTTTSPRAPLTPAGANRTGAIGAAGPGRDQPRPPFEPGRTINLTGRTHPSAPTLDDGQAGPKVLGKIDLRKPAPKAAPTGARPAGVPRPGMPPRPGGPQRPGMPPRPGERRFGAPPPSLEAFAPPPADSGKPGARPVKKKKVIKKGAPDIAAEREMRGLRVPRKKRALPGKELRKTEITTPKASKRVVRITEGVTVADLARNMGVKAAEIIKQLMGLGVMSTLNQVLDVDTATLVAGEFGYSVENVAFDAESAIEEEAEAAPGEALPRPPVVTVMGHVDHGKTSLLDAIRHTNVTEREFGGITQHIGAYMVEVHGRRISFVDTPGHEAFTAMRARGAKVTDIVILVVAADEGVMPQTVEALNHAKAAGVPIIVAINKVDRPEANIDRVKQQLTERGLIPEDYGGDTIVVPVSARTGEGIERLLEMIMLQADVMELKANPNRAARGAVIESQIDRGRGPVATVLIQEGTLHTGDAFVCGTSYGRVRAMQNHLGERVTEAGPSTPVEVFGLSGVPEPGTAFVAVAEESKARQVAEFRRSRLREGALQRTSRVSLEELSEKMLAGEVKELRIIIKGDVNGSVEALADSLVRLSTGEVKLEIIHKSVGAISETDVTLASASKAIIIGFNVRPEPKAAQLAEKEGVDIRLYTIIYEVINDIREAMEGLLAPTYREKALGRAEIRQTFVVGGLTVGGAMVLDGKVQRSARARLVRDGRVVWEGKIASLKRFKDDAREVLAGYECGIGLESFNDLKPGDIIEDFEMETVLRKLEPARIEATRGAPAQPQP